MTLTNLHKTPWPYFGGKADAAEAVWAALGDVPHYVEPFAGSLAVLMRRPHPCNRPYFSETVNDLDGLLVNSWRSMRASPDEMADAASWPVTEADLTARHLALVRWRAAGGLDRLRSDPDWHDAKMAGWWAWGLSCWIGSGWCSGRGPWVIGDDGVITKRPGSRAGVSSQLPHIANDGRGVNHPGCRKPGVSSQLPHIANNGQGVNRPGCREPGVSSKLPVLGNNGQGVNHPGCREPGVGDYHPMTMPELIRWFRFLSARLRHVRVLNGDWRRAVTTGAAHTLPVRQGDGPCGVFLDPPYGDVRSDGLYAEDSLTVASDVREWCIANGDDPRFRIVLAGFDTEHADLEARGWRVVEWFKPGFLKGGMAQQNGDGHSQHRERLWLSPHCLGARQAQGSLF